jgi:hypothetical protein
LILERHRKRSRSESSSSFYSKSSRKISSSSESESSRSRKHRKEKSKKDKRKGREVKDSKDAKDAKDANKSRNHKKEVKKNKKLSNADELGFDMRKDSQEIDLKHPGEDDLTPKVERKDENIENLEGCDLRVEEKNINFVEHAHRQNNSNNFENIDEKKLQELSTKEQIYPQDKVENSTQLTLIPNQQEENKYEQGIELRSRILGEDSTSINAIEVFTAFKKINYLDIPNVHRKL